MIVNNYFHGKKLSYNQSYLNTLIAGIILEIAPLPPPPTHKKNKPQNITTPSQGKRNDKF